MNVNIGLCETNNLIVNDTFVWYYQRAYVSMYVICLLVVIVLYVAVFYAVLRQRDRRQKRRRNQLMAAANTASSRRVDTAEVTEMVTVVPGKDHDAGVVGGTDVIVIANEDRQPSAVVQPSKSRENKMINQRALLDV